jgi:hypothetical protein
MPDQVDGKPLWDKLRPRGVPEDPGKPPPPKEVQKLEAMQKLLERMAGSPLDEIAKQYSTELTVKPGEILTEERKKEVREEFERLAFERLAPLVLAVFEANLKMGSLDAAKTIGLSLGIIKPPPAMPSKVTIVNPDGAKPINSIEEWRLERQTRSYKTATPKRLGGDSVS